MSLGMYLAVATGGALGAMARYSVTLFVGGGIFGVAGPLATIMIVASGPATPKIPPPTNNVTL